MYVTIHCHTVQSARAMIANARLRRKQTVQTAEAPAGGALLPDDPAAKSIAGWTLMSVA
jgi:hypothetical protein